MLMKILNLSSAIPYNSKYNGMQSYVGIDYVRQYLQYTSNLTKHISSFVYCLTMFNVCHMFVLKYYLRPNSF